MTASGKSYSGRIVLIDDNVIAGERRVVAEVDNERQGDGESSSWTLNPGSNVQLCLIQPNPSDLAAR